MSCAQQVLVGLNKGRSFGRLDQVERRFDLGCIDLKTHEALQQRALEMDESRVLRIDGWVRFEPLKCFEESSSEFAIGGETPREQEGQLKIQSCLPGSDAR